MLTYTKISVIIFDIKNSYRRREMFCRNCGKEIDEQAAICVGCGYKNGDGNKYCFHCGEKVDEGASVCLKCGYSLAKKQKNEKNGTIDGEEVEYSEKSRLTAGLLACFLGGLGVHNFYLGNNKSGVLHIVASFCCGLGIIWGLIDGIMIFCDKNYKDAEGKILK